MKAIAFALLMLTCLSACFAPKYGDDTCYRSVGHEVEEYRCP